MKTEKPKSSDKSKTPFGWGYSWGIQTYKKYPKATASERKALSERIADNKDEAKNGKGRSRENAIGFMTAMRDAAIARKSRRKK